MSRQSERNSSPRIMRAGRVASWMSDGATPTKGEESRSVVAASLASADVPIAKDGEVHSADLMIDFLRQRGYGARPDDPVSVSQAVSSFLGDSIMKHYFVVWLRSLGLVQYETAFREIDIDETVLPSLTHETLKELGRRE